MCHYHCPPECNEQEMRCSGGEDHYGCPHPEMCMPSTIPGLNGAECPNQCPNDICAPGDQACDMGYDDAGCPAPPMCMPTSIPSTVDPEMECWLGCDMQCGEDMELCDMGMDEQGCPRPKECRLTKNNGWDPVTQTEVECAFQCPMPCAANEMRCGEWDENGCPSAGICMPRSVPSTVDPEVMCWLSCDPQCGVDMELCDLGMDEQGCPRPRECRYTKNNGWDAVAQTEVECPFQCPMPCSAEEMRCGEMDENGCPSAGVCVLREYAAPYADDTTCYGQCDPQCGQDHELCDMGLDENGCQRPMECRYTKHTYWDEAVMEMMECGFSCPALCPHDMMRCEEHDLNGCPMPGTCVPMGEPCPNYAA